MATKERYQNPTVGDEVNLKLFAYNSNNRSNFSSIQKVEIYFLDPAERSDSNPDGRVLVEAITDFTNEEEGLYAIALSLESPKYRIGKYIDVWYIVIEENENISATENSWEIFSDLWYTTTIPIVYDFDFHFRPNKIKKGSKKHLIIEISPNVPNAKDLNAYYENLAIVAPLKLSIEMNCVECMPEEEDLRLVVDRVDVEFREKLLGYYFLDTTELDLGIYNIWFEMEFGESLYISDKSNLQIY